MGVSIIHFSDVHIVTRNDSIFDKKVKTPAIEHY